LVEAERKDWLKQGGRIGRGREERIGRGSKEGLVEAGRKDW
jgi:hypothetical protein